MTSRLETATVAGALVLALGALTAPAAGQDSERYDSQVFIGRGDKTFSVSQVLPRDQSDDWEVCVFATNNERRAKRVKYEVSFYGVDGSPAYEFINYDGTLVDRSFRLQKRGKRAYGWDCHKHSMSPLGSGYRYALVVVDFDTATAGEVGPETHNEYGLSSVPVPGGFESGVPLGEAAGRLERRAGPRSPNRAR